MVERYAALRTEVTKPAYAAQTDAQVLAAITALNVPVVLNVSGDTMRTTLMLRAAAIWDKLLDAAASHPQAAVKIAASGFVDAVRLLGVWPLSEPAAMTAFTGRLDTFVNATPQVLTPGQRTAALALSGGFTSIADRDGFSSPTLDEIQNARI